MAVREVANRLVFRLDPREDFRETIPATFVESEQDAARILQSWDNLVDATNELIRKRRWVVNRYTKRAVFHAGMERLCKDFSQRSENVKINLIQKNNYEHTKSRQVLTYVMDVFKLKPVAEEVRNVHDRCVAEIPPQHLHREPRAVQIGVVPSPQAALPPTTAPQSVAVNDQGSSSSTGGGVTFATAIAVSFDDENVDIEAASRSGSVRDSTQSTQPEVSVNSPPVAPRVTFASPVNDHQPPVATAPQLTMSVLERMQHLESVKTFLSESEYASKRQEILAAI